MESGYSIDPTNVLVEEPKIQEADELISTEPILDELPEEKREDAVDHVARLVTHNEMCLFLDSDGAHTIIATNFRLPSKEEKMIIVHGKKQQQGIINRIYVIDPQDLDDFLENM